MIINIYTDGAYSSKTECGGWGCVVVIDNNIYQSNSGNERFTTNNRMEMQGFLSALESVSKLLENNIAVDEINIHTDSAYISNCFIQKWYENWRLNGWRTADKQPVKNKDLWGAIIGLYEVLSSQTKINIYKVKAHQKGGDSHAQWNKYVDLLAVRKREELD